MKIIKKPRGRNRASYMAYKTPRITKAKKNGQRNKNKQRLTASLI